MADATDCKNLDDAYHVDRNAVFGNLASAIKISQVICFICHHIKPDSVSSYISGMSNVLEPHFDDVWKNCNHLLVTRTLAGMKKLQGTSVQRKPSMSSDELKKLLTEYGASSSPRRPPVHQPCFHRDLRSYATWQLV